jgi:DNA-binding response OmpR family regulator
MGPSPASPARRVLVVDDEIDTRVLAVDVLSAQRYAVDEASTGLNAILRISAREYGAIILDVMPGMDGRGVLETLSRWNPEVLSRVIVVTGAPGSLEDEEGGRVFSVLTKPSAFSELVEVVGRS